MTETGLAQTLSADALTTQEPIERAARKDSRHLLVDAGLATIRACRGLFADNGSGEDRMRGAARLVIQVALVVAGLLVLNEVLLLGLAKSGGTMASRAVMLTIVAAIYAGIYRATNLKQRLSPAAWSSVALVLVELCVAAVMFPFLVRLVQALLPAGLLERIFAADWEGPAVLVAVVFVGSRGWARCMQRASQVASAKAQAELYERLAFEDQLTGLANRRRLEARLNEWLAPTALAKENVTLILIDVDQFKAVNDNYSHNVGDAVLRQIGQVLATNLAPSDLPARLAGDEFVVVLRGYSEAQAAGACARLSRAVADFEWNGLAVGLKVSISIGCAGATLGEPMGELLRRSDERMYNAKRRRLE